jgi:hypothetical protein
VWVPTHIHKNVIGERSEACLPAIWDNEEWNPYLVTAWTLGAFPGSRMLIQYHHRERPSGRESGTQGRTRRIANSRVGDPAEGRTDVEREH